MKMHHLRDLLAVAERGSLRAASRDLGIAQPALSRSIRELERELGAPLFERRARGVVLTPIGERFVRRAGEEVAQLLGRGGGRLAMCLSSAAHLMLLPDAMPAFRKRHPQIELDLREGTLPSVESELLAGRLDFYLGPVPDARAGSGLEVEKLFDNARVIVARRGHPLTRARSLRELVGAEWLTTSVTPRVEDEIGPLFAERNLPPPRLVVHAHTALGFLSAIAASDLLTLLPVQWLASPLTRDALTRIPAVDSLPAPPICIVRRAGLPPTPAAEYFCDLVRRSAAPYARGSTRARRSMPSAMRAGGTVA